MADKKPDGAVQAAANSPRPGKDSAAAPVREPRLLARIVGDHGGTATLIGGVIAVLSAWVIWDKLGQDDLARRIVPLPNYLLLAAGVLLVGFAQVVRYLLAEEVELVARRQRWLKESKLLLKEARRGLRLYKGQLKPEQEAQVKDAADALDAARAKTDWLTLHDALQALDHALDEHLSYARKSTAREYTESIAVAVLIALFLRAFVVEAFKIPSGSMIPTLQVGDHIFVNKFIYGIRLPWPLDETDFGRAHQKFFMEYRKPKRGEVIVFKFPKDQEKDFIKRIVAVEGDAIEIKQNVVHVNGVPMARAPEPGACEYEDFDEPTGHWEHRRCDGYRETLPDGTNYETIFNRETLARSWNAHDLPGLVTDAKGQAVVPPGSVFVMGDNRDNSHDSRYWGVVPFELIKGKAMVIWWSTGEPEGIRVKRMFHAVD